VQVGDIREGSTGPLIITSMQEVSSGVSFSSATPIPGPPSKDQQEYRDYQERWDRRQAEQDAAYEAMKQSMRDVINETGTDIEWPHYVAIVVDKICELYSDYADKWETE
jgi:hypothetical protein